MVKKFLPILIVFSFLILGNNNVMASDIMTPISIPLNQSYYLNVGTSEITQIAIANPTIADAVVASSTEILINAKSVGSTTLRVWTNNGMRQQFNINVLADNLAIAQAIKRVLPNDEINVQNSIDNILLQGSVKNQYEKDIAEKIAQVYGKKVINLLQMSKPYQVKIEAQIIEISMDKSKELGLLFSNASDIDTDTGLAALGPSGSFGVGQSFAKSYADINATLQALETKGDAKVLSRPNITTLSGEKASILIGGKIPIPKSNDNGEISIEWRDYGIKLNIEPTVHSAKDITTKIKAEVSTLDYSHEIRNNEFTIPALQSREASTNISIASGTTMAIGGLINSEESKTINKFPILGDLPIIGSFFRHTAKSKDKRELIILITPTLVGSDTPVKMSDDMHELYNNTQKDNRKDVSLNKESVAAEK